MEENKRRYGGFNPGILSGCTFQGAWKCMHRTTGRSGFVLFRFFFNLRNFALSQYIHIQIAIASVDLFMCIKYVLLLYEGATKLQPYMEVKTYQDFWFGFDRYVVERLREVPATGADVVIQRGAAAFFSVSVKEMLSCQGIKDFCRVTQPFEAVPVTATLASTLPLWYKVCCVVCMFCVCSNHVSPLKKRDTLICFSKLQTIALLLSAKLIL